jgi:hypothetical protein
MEQGQQLNKPNFIYRATTQQRLISALIFLGIICIFGFLWLGAHGSIDLSVVFHPCGFQQRYHLPCPTCGMTTAAVAFVQGQFLKSFYIQPAGALFCCILVLTAFLSFIIAVFGVYFHFLKRFFTEIKIKYIILAFIIIIFAGWAVTLARALAARSQA